jgi:hypothetical protein
MTLFGRRYRMHWGHFAVLTGMAAASTWYLSDARSVSLSINNLILVQPVAILVLLLYLFILPQCLVAENDDGGEAARAVALEDVPQLESFPVPEGRFGSAVRVISLSLALVFYVSFYERVGFDIASFLFIAVCGFICGERSPIRLLVFAPLGAVLLVYAGRLLVAVPIPSAFF